MDSKNKTTHRGASMLALLEGLLAVMQKLLQQLLQAVKHPAMRPVTDRNRGDVPGWVLITLMSAILVAGLLAIAGPALEGMFQDAMGQVNPGG